ncbi:flagellar basal body L-ring protein FlgH [Derxia gummosa]|uniref:Flagellar L-ring protein n=1 Tax=Derxia gummosa DSM 723 TaxID=1121388 RepID=A0A9U5C6G8_9BURK|nr:flagellar basal body L-ring protein FlgH [Derxia gummosa]
MRAPLRVPADRRSPMLLLLNLLLIALAAALMAGCAQTPMLTAPPPYAIRPSGLPDQIERPNNGAIYQAGLQSNSLFTSERKPRYIGDTLKVDIAENLAATRKVTTDTSRENAMSQKGPGGSGSGVGIFDRILNLNASASGSDSFKGSGAAGDSSSFTGKLAVSVINVLPNGNLVVAGEKSISMGGNASVLRFAGVVNPGDIQSGNIVASANVINAKFDVGGKGDLQDSASRNWVQRYLTNYFSVW